MENIENIIDNIDSGDILLVSTKKWFPKLIQWFQENKYNHATLLFKIYDTVFVIEAAERGIRIKPLTHYTDKPKKYDLLVLKYNKKITKVKKEEITKYCLGHCGNTPYEYKNLLFLQAVKYAAKKLFGSELWIGTEDEKKASKKFICGEWCAYIYNKYFDLFENEWYKIAPKDLYESDFFNHITI